MQRTKHELLSPAGDRECLRAAVCGGADAVYFGASSFNARARASNFSSDELKEAVDYCHAYGKKAYITLNTAIKDKELDTALSLAGDIYSAGADALICADLGLISLIKKQIPDFDIHVSTQAGVRSAEGADVFSRMGASRVVLARELSRDEIFDVTKNAIAETEVFIHGAICVSVSGRCLFSSLVGGRSGNRGECAQPCRLAYGRDGYILSLKDMCLAKHIKELCDIGVASFKIEGRMKSPEYVYSVTKIYRRLIDSLRNASDEELQQLEKVFSRGGFTDGYYTGRISPAMKGIRGELTEPKRELRERLEEPKRPLKLSLTVKEGVPFTLTYEREDGRQASFVGDIPQTAQNRPMGKEDYLRPLTSLGNTPFFVSECNTELDEGLMLPVSALKNARRDAVARLSEGDIITRERVETKYISQGASPKAEQKSAKYYLAESVSEEARRFFDVIFVPAEKYASSVANGAFLPEITSEGESESLNVLLSSLKKKGCRHVLVSDMGQLAAARRVGFENIHTDIGFNLYNLEQERVIRSLGATRQLASPELTLSAQRSLGGVVVYGRIPLMTLKKCIGRELIGCKRCMEGNGIFSFKDRKGVTFTGMRAISHGSVIFNSLPTYIGDTEDARRLTDIHFIFTTESRGEADRVILAYKNREALGVSVRRIK